MPFDLKNNIKVMRSIAPVAVGTTGTGQTGKVIDRAGYESVTFVLNYGSITATNAVLTATIKEGDATGTMTSVADADLIGTELAASVGATGTRTSGTSKAVAKTVGYKGVKRYVQALVKSTVTAGTLVAATAVLGNPRNAPTT